VSGVVWSAIKSSGAMWVSFVSLSDRHDVHRLGEVESLVVRLTGISEV
jgi:hypothetical protein